MRQLLRNEYSRLWKNKVLYVVFGVEMLIVFLHFGYEVLRWKDVIAYGTYPLGVFQKWIGANWSSLYSWLYFMLLPLLLAIPYGGTFLEDIKTGYVKNVFTRIGKGEYLWSKFIVAFTTGILGLVPLVLDFMMTASVLPALIPQASTGVYHIGADYLYAELFYEHPYLYLGIWLLQDILFLGMLAVSSLTVSFFCEYTYVPILFPFLLSMLSFGVGAAVGYAPLAMFHIISPAQTRGMSLGVIGAEFSLLLLIGGGYFYAGYKKELF